MTSFEAEIKVRSMTLEDLDTISLIDQKIRELGKAITYANLTTEHIFITEREASLQERPISHADLITGGVGSLLEYGFVAEVEGRVCGFILGQVAYVGKPATQVGSIIILGVHPDYWRRGIGTQLVDAICEKYRSEGIKTVRIGIDESDKQLRGLFKHMGFIAAHVIECSKAI